MGYADLELVHQAAVSDPLPAVHSHGSAHEHLAIARRIMVGDQVAVTATTTGTVNMTLRLLLDGTVIDVVRKVEGWE